MLGLIAIIVILCWIGSAFGTEACAIAMLIAIVGLFVLGCMGFREDRKAFYNWRDYWADGGPDRDRRR